MELEVMTRKHRYSCEVVYLVNCPYAWTSLFITKAFLTSEPS